MAYSSPKQAYEEKYDEDSDYCGFYAHTSSLYNEAVTNQMRMLFNFFKSGDINGDCQIQYGGINNLALLLPGCGRFKKVIAIEFLDGRLQCFKNWQNKDPAAHDYSQAVKTICQMEGESGKEIEKEETARNSIVDVIKGELTDTHPVAPKLGYQVSCLTTSYSTEVLSANLDAFCAAVKSMATLIKSGGYLIMNVLLGCNFVVIGGHKLPILDLNEECVKKAITEAGLNICNYYVIPRLNDPLCDAINFTHIMFLIAIKRENAI